MNEKKILLGTRNFAIRAWVLMVMLICIIVVQIVKCHTVGSNKASSRQQKTFFRDTDDENKMVGFSVFEYGLALENESTVCTFDAFFPISGAINLNGGTLYLAKDAVFRSPLKLTSGIIDGCGYSLGFPSNVVSTQIPSAYHNKLLYFCDMKDIGDNINDISWSPNDKYVATVCDSFGGDELQIYYFDTMDQKLSLTASYNFGNISAYSVKWHPTEYYLAVGKYGDSELCTFYFNPNTAILEVIDTADIGTVYDVDWSPDGKLLAVGGSARKDLLVYKVNDGVLDSCYTCTLHTANVTVPKHGLAWNSTGECLAASFKVNNSTYRLKIFNFNDEYFTDDTYFETSDRMSAIAWKPGAPFIAVGFTSSSQRLRFYEHDSLAHTISEVMSARSGERRHIYEVKWKGDYLAYLKDQSNITYELKVCYFDEAEKTFSIVAGANCSKDLEALAWSNSGDYVAAGGTKDYLVVFKFASAPLVFKDIKIFFDSDVIIGGDVIFEGSCILDCGRNNLEFSDEGSITVASGSSLFLSDAIIRGVSGNKIACVDDDCVIKLKDVAWILDGNYTFSTGALIFDNDILMTGDYIFAYQSTQTSTILSKSTLELDVGFTFNYNAANSESKNLIELEDKTSVLLLNGGTLHTSCQGMQLKKGRLRVLRDSFISSEKKIIVDEGDKHQMFIDEGITFGNNAIEDDFLCDIYAGATLYVTQGSLNYKNVSDFSWNMASLNSFLHMHSETVLNLYQSLKLGAGAIIFDNRTTLGKALGKDIIGSIKPYGKLFYTSI